MPTLEDWQDWVAGQDDRLIGGEVIRYIFEERPQWLPASSVVDGVIVRFEPILPDVEPLLISATKQCLLWGSCCGEIWEGSGYRARNVALRTVRRIDWILRGEVECVVGRLLDGRIVLKRLSDAGRASVLSERNLTDRMIQRLEVTNWLTGKRRIRPTFPPQ